MKLIKQLCFIFLLMPVAALSTLVNASPHHGFAGAVFTATNAADGNEILMFKRTAKGQLDEVGRFSTGGLGTGAGLGNQGGVVLSDDNRWLFVVNAGSNEVSVFKVNRKGLRLVDVEPSGGEKPVSLAMDGHLLYVLNAGSDSISGFNIDEQGDLSPLANSTRSLSGAGSAPAQISFTPWGDALVVTEKASNLISVFLVNEAGIPGEAVLNASAGITPFGFDFDRRGHLLVSEAAGGAAGASSVSSYQIDSEGYLQVISAAVPSAQSAACWLLVAKHSRIAYTTNTGSGTLSAYNIKRDGSIALTQADGVAAHTVPGSRPIDMAQSNNGRFVYALSATGASISIFHVNHRGGLTAVSSVEGLAEGLNGLAAF